MSIDYSHNYDDDFSFDKNFLNIFNPSIQIIKNIGGLLDLVKLGSILLSLGRQILVQMIEMNCKNNEKRSKIGNFLISRKKR